MTTVDFSVISRTISILTLRLAIFGEPLMAANFETAVNKFKKDKIFLGLILAAMLILGVGAFFTQDDEKKPAGKTTTATRPVQTAAAPSIPPLEPSLATDFVKWWLTNAMDYKAQSAKASHTEAFRWMTSESLRAFQSNFWTQEIERGIISGQVTAVFQPVSVQPVAVNPDGSVVIASAGTLVIQSNGTPMTQQVSTDFLVKRDAQGLRIAGLFNRPVTTASAASAPSPY